MAIAFVAKRCRCHRRWAAASPKEECRIVRHGGKNARMPVFRVTRRGLGATGSFEPVPSFSEKRPARPRSEERFRVSRQVVAAGPFRARIPEYPCLRPDRRLDVERSRRNDHGFELRNLTRHDASAVAAELARKPLRFRDFVEPQELFAGGEYECPVLYHDVGRVACSGRLPAPFAVAMIEGRGFSFHFISDRTAKTAAD